jgi:DNA-binding Lrp family transcriptional regulator
MSSLDKTDIRILDILQKDSKTTIKEIAHRLNLSTTPIFERIKRMETQGIISQYVAIVDPKKLGIKLTAFIEISIIDHSMQAIDAFVEAIQIYPEVIECHHVTGDSDFLITILTEDIESYNNFITKKLSKAPNVGKVRSSFSLSTKKKTTAIKLS